MRRERPNESFYVVGGVIFTVLMHALIVVGYLIVRASELAASPPDEPVQLQFIPVELPMLGEYVPNPNELPVIANPAPEVRPEEVVEITPPEEEPPPPEPPPEEEPVEVEREPQEEEPDQRHDDDRHNEERPVNNERLTGLEDGVDGGTTLSPTALQNLFSRMQQQIQRAFRAPSSLSREQLEELEAMVQIRVNSEGRILNVEFVERSGNSAFDSAVETALNTFRLGSQRLHMPTTNEQAMDLALDEGIVITIRHQ